MGKRPGAISNPAEYFSADIKERKQTRPGGPDESSANMSVCEQQDYKAMKEQTHCRPQQSGEQHQGLSFL